MPGLPAFPSFDIEGRQFSRLLLGHNPFLGGSYMSEARTRLYKGTFGVAREILVGERSSLAPSLSP